MEEITLIVQHALQQLVSDVGNISANSECVIHCCAIHTVSHMCSPWLYLDSPAIVPSLTAGL